jgi:hypothetical protein
LVIGGTFVLRPMRRPWRTRLLIITGVALVASVPRALALQAIPSTPTSGTYLVVEYTASVVAAIVAVGAGLLVATLMGMTRSEERRRVAGRGDGSSRPRSTTTARDRRRRPRSCTDWSGTALGSRAVGEPSS